MSLRLGATFLLCLSALIRGGSALAQPPPSVPEKSEKAATPSPLAASQVSAPPHAAPPPSPRPQPAASSAPTHDKLVKQAMVLHDEAWELYKDGRYRGAIDKLETARGLDPRAKELVYNLALLHEKLAETADAARYYRRYLDMESDPRTKTRVEAILRRLDGVEREQAERARRAEEGRRSHPGPRSRLQPPVIVAGGIAGVALVLGTVLGISALAKAPGDNLRTGAGVSIGALQDDARSAHARAIGADVSFFVALAGAGTATFLHFSLPKTTRAETGAGVGGVPVSFSPAGLTVTF